MAKKYYKVVAVVDGKLRSLYSSSLPKKFRLKYRTGHVTKTKPGTPGVFVFDDLNVAQRKMRMLRYRSNPAVYEAFPIGRARPVTLRCKRNAIGLGLDMRGVVVPAIRLGKRVASVAV